jgi:predicted RNA-binding Zn-ribbon protein involved in translation (DUF1610 family)
MKRGTCQRTVAGLVLNEREITCPHCGIGLIISSASSTVFKAQQTCPSCKNHFLIVNDVAITSDEYEMSLKAA